MGSKKSFARRSRFDILYEILLLCRRPQQKTGIMFKCNLSYDLLQTYTEFLVGADFLRVSEAENGKKYYYTTEKGENFIREYEELKDVLDAAEKRRSIGNRNRT